MSESPKLVARGTLGKVPLADFLIRALDDRLEGTLILQRPRGGKDAVLFVRGAPAKARLHEQSVFLGEVLVDLEMIPRSVAVSTRKRADAAKRSHGEVLLDEGYIDQTGLYVALREQLTRQIFHLCELPDDTFFGLYQANYLSKWGPAGQWRVKPLPVIWRSLVEHLPDARRNAVLNHCKGYQLRMRQEAPVARYRLNSAERGVVDVLRAKPQPLNALEQSGAGPQELVQRVACALLLSRQLEGFSHEKEPVGYHEPPETPQSVLPPPPGARRTTSGSFAGRMPTPNMRPAIPSMQPGTPSVRPGTPGRSSTPSMRPATPSMRPATPSMRPATPSMRPATPAQRPATPAQRPAHPKRAAQGEHEAQGEDANEQHAAFRSDVEAYDESPPATFYDVLGVDREADAGAVRSAFFQLARRWHPDKLPPELADLRPIVSKAFARMGEAHQVLTDPARRHEYDQKLDEAPDDEQEKVAKILEAAAAFQRAEVLNKKRDYPGALREARLALEGDPEQADYLAMVAWLDAALHGNGEYEQQMAMLDSALDSDPNNVRALWYRGQLFKKMGKHLPAMRDFKRILKIQPKHVEARRELRVFEMRKRSDAKANSGFFGKLLKKD